jgi:D-threo-aldose 1-dehydrogenase
MNPVQPVRLGRADLQVTRLGLGGGPLAGLFAEVSESGALGAIGRAVELGVRLFDTAPLYGLGLSEQRLGRGLREYPRDSFVLASKAGRLLVPLCEGEIVQSNFARPLPFRPVFDFSYDAVMRSLECSLERLGLDRIDILHVHDPDDAFEQVMRETYPALEKLRSQGVVRAIGAAMNQWEMLARFARECDFDCFLLASRYTLIDQTALPEFLPLCLEKGIGVILGGPYNSGILASGATPGAKFEYKDAPAGVVNKVRQIESVCGRHGVPLRAAALQFPLAHPAVAAVIPGSRSAAEVEENCRLIRLAIPRDFWGELREQALLPPDAPAPGD